MASDGYLYDVALPSGVATPIGLGVASTDIALATNGTLYGCTGNWLFQIDRRTVAATFIGINLISMNALDAAPDGTLYAAGSISGALIRLDPSTLVETQVATYPSGLTSSGDIAIVQGRLYASAATASQNSDTLVAVNLDGGASSVVGPIGFKCVYGLAAYGSLLYGFTCNGEVLSIDLSTGGGTLLANTGINFMGASAR